MKDKSGPIDHKKCTAYHEAGHAVAAILLNKKFKYITIKPDADSLGKVASKSGNRYKYEYNSITDPCQFSKYFLADFRKIAGLVSERMYSGKNNFTGAKWDIAQIIDNSLIDLPEILSKKYLTFLSEYTFNVLSIASNQIMLDAIANELLHRETLSYAEVREIMRESLLKRSQGHA